MNALELLDDVIAELEARLNLKPGEAPRGAAAASGDAGRVDSKGSLKGVSPTTISSKADKKQKSQASKNDKSAETSKAAESDENQPEICKLELKVGVIRKVWVHPTADKLYCEEIDVNEPDGPRLIASGLRAHFTLEEMLDQKVLVVSNLKAKNLVGFKSHGMVLCAAATASEDGTERVEFVEPPDSAIVGEIVTFEGLPSPRPVTAAQVEKKKVFQNCMPGMRTTKECIAAWDGHSFLTSAGPCRVKSLADACLR